MRDGVNFHLATQCVRPETFYDVDRFRCRNCAWETTPRDPDSCVAAVCACGATVFHESQNVIEGFLAFHEPGRRPTCTRVETGQVLDEVRGRFATAEQLGVLFL
jgi:hypothetical protein